MKNDIEIPEWLVQEKPRRLKSIKGKKGKFNKQTLLNVAFYILMLVIALGIIFSVATLERWTDTLFEQMQIQEVSAMEEEKVVVVALVTAYSEIDSCHYENCAMASGKRAYVGAIACPRDIELGTEVIIDNTTYICEDRTNKNLDGRYDIFIGYGQSSYDEAIVFGIKEKEVEILL